MKLDFFAVLIHAAIALSFGIVRELYNQKNIRREGIVILTNGIVSLFVGVSVFFLCRSFSADDYLTAFLTSISGWIGGSLMDFFEKVGKRLIEKKSESL